MFYYVLLCSILMIDQNRQYVSNNFIFTRHESNINLSGRSRGGGGGGGGGGRGGGGWDGGGGAPFGNIARFSLEP